MDYFHNKQEHSDALGILSLISQPGDRPFVHRIRLQKLALLAQQEFGYPFSFVYQSYYYGPYSFELRSLITLLSKAGLANEAEEIHPVTGGSVFKYSLTEKGREFIGANQTPDLDKIKSAWDKYGNLSNAAIISRAKEVSGINSLGE